MPTKKAPNTPNTMTNTEKLIAVSTQITDNNIKQEFLKLIPKIDDPNARAHLEGLKNELALDLSVGKVAVVIGVLLQKVDIDQEKSSKKASRQSRSSEPQA